MKYTVRFSRRSDRQLEDIYAYIAREASPEIALRFTECLAEYCYGLADAPHRGTLRHDIRPNLRVIGFRRTASIQFMVLGREILILGITYRGKNYARDYRRP